MKKRIMLWMGVVLFAVTLCGPRPVMLFADNTDKIIARWENLKCTGHMEGRYFDNRFGTLIATRQGLEHRGPQVLMFPWAQIRSIRLDQLQNRIFVELVEESENFTLATILDYSRFRFEAIDLQLRLLQRRFGKHEAPPEVSLGSKKDLETVAIQKKPNGI